MRCPVDLNDSPSGTVGRALKLARSYALLARTPWEGLRELHGIHGPAMRLGVGRYSVHLLFSPAANEYVLGTGPDGFLWRDGVRCIIPITGDRAFGVCDGFEHQRYRLPVEPAFSRMRLEQAHARIAKEIRSLISSWEDGERIDLIEALRPAVRGAVLGALFKDDVVRHAGEIGKYFQPGLDYMNTMAVLFQAKVPGTPFARVMASRRQADLILYDIIRQRRAQFALADPDRDVLDLLLDPLAGGRLGPLTDLEIRDQIAELLAAGQETTTAALGWLFHLLMLNEATFVKVRAEVMSAPDDVVLSSTQWRHLSLLRAAVSETLRLFPPVATTPRRAKHAFSVEGYAVPAGGFLMISQYVTQRDPELWRYPDDFMPSRWSKSAGSQDIRRYSYFPFGLGRRRCIGINLAKRVLVIFATELIKNIQLEPQFTTLAKTAGVVTMVPQSGVPVIVRVRNGRPG